MEAVALAYVAAEEKKVPPRHPLQRLNKLNEFACKWVTDNTTPKIAKNWCGKFENNTNKFKWVLLTKYFHSRKYFFLENDLIFVAFMIRIHNMVALESDEMLRTIWESHGKTQPLPSSKTFKRHSNSKINFCVEVF